MAYSCTLLIMACSSESYAVICCNCHCCCSCSISGPTFTCRHWVLLNVPVGGNLLSPLPTACSAYHSLVLHPISIHVWFLYHFFFRWKTHKWRRCQLVPWSVRQDSPGAQETCGPGLQIRGEDSHIHTQTTQTFTFYFLLYINTLVKQSRKNSVTMSSHQEKALDWAEMWFYWGSVIIHQILPYTCSLLKSMEQGSWHQRSTWRLHTTVICKWYGTEKGDVGVTV